MYFYYRSLWGRWRAGGSPPKDQRVLKKLLDKVADALKRLLGKAMGFVSEHTWILIVFIAGRIGAWLMQRVLRKQAGKKVIVFFCGPQYPSQI